MPIDSYEFGDRFPLVADTTFKHSPTVIVSHFVYKTNSTSTLDVIDSLAKFNVNVMIATVAMTLLLVLLLTCYKKLMKKSGCNQITWNVVRALVNQHDFNVTQYYERSIALIVIMFAFWLVQFYNAYFSTDLVVDRQASVIDSLRDLVDGDTYPMFPSGSGIPFKQATSGLMKQVWQKHLSNRKFNGVLEINAQTFQPMNEKLSTQEGALITSEDYEKIVRIVHCTFTVGGNCENRYYVSREDQTYTSTELLLFSANIEENIRLLLHKKFVALFEMHVLKKMFGDDIYKYFYELMGGGSSEKMTQCARQTSLPQREEKPTAVKIDNVSKSFKWFGYAIGCCFCIFLAECKVRIRKVHKAFKRMLCCCTIALLSRVITTISYCDKLRKYKRKRKRCNKSH